MFSRLFDDAANKLNLKSLLGFLSELVFCSHKQLLTIYPKKAGLQQVSTKLSKQNGKGGKNGVGGRRDPSKSTATLLFHRISEVMLKCVRSGRPLMHIVKAWATVGPHLMEVTTLLFNFALD